MNQPNPWGENWHNENYSSAEMDELLGRIAGAKYIFMGFQSAGKRKWVRTRSDGTMELIWHHPNVLGFYSGIGLSFPWIPHGNWKDVKWHKTPKTAIIDLGFDLPMGTDWFIPKRRTVAAERAKVVSTEVCEVCEPWFHAMSDNRKIWEEMERLHAMPDSHIYVQQLTAYEFWRARVGQWNGFDEITASQLKSFFGEPGFPKVKQLLEDEAARSKS